MFKWKWSDLEVQLCYTPLYTLHSEYVVICSSNAHSVNLHLEDISVERIFLRADILIHTQFKLHQQDKIVTSGRTVHINDFSFKWTPYGSVMQKLNGSHQYVKKNIILAVYRPPSKMKAIQDGTRNKTAVIL